MDNDPEARPSKLSTLWGRFRAHTAWIDSQRLGKFWLLALSLAVGYTLVFALPDYLGRLQSSRIQSSLSNCTLNVAQDDVLRAIINASLAEQAKKYPHLDPFGHTIKDRQNLTDKLMAPLGGTSLSAESRVIRHLVCVRRSQALAVK